MSIADERRASIKACGGAGITLALQVEDIDSVRTNAEALGLKPTAIKRHPWNARVFYMFDPDVREEVVFQKQFREPGINFMETVCRYSQYLDPNYNNINGFPKEKLKTKHYNIEALIENSGKFIASSDMSFEVLMSGTQLVTMLLHEELKVDSIVDSAGNKISFLRYEKDKYKSSPIYLFFNRPLNYGESVTLKFYYQGDIIEREMGEFFVNAGADWYPTYGYNQRATFDMTFKTGKEMEFIASGNLLEKKKSDDTLITKWKVIPPAKNISFNLGNMKRYRFDEEVISPVNVYYSRDFHNEMARYLSKEMIATGKDMQNQVAEDIINSMKLFEHYFGEYPYPEINVSEILYSHGEAFPAFLHLGFDTWVNTDPWGNDRMFRAHEVAHQWWGIGVGYKTYHDQWLSEGFAEYSSLLYLQAVSGNDKFLEKIKEYRDDIFSARKYFLGSGEESGPIALGYRTSSSKTRGDYGLIIYKKSAMVLHMLRNLLIDFSNMNEDLFFQMLKEFYQKYRGNIVTTDDFKLFTEKYTGIDMTWFFNQWVYRSEIPTFDFSYDIAIDNKGKYTANCHITTKDVAEDFKMYLPVEIEIDKDSKAYIRVLVDSPNFDFTLPNLPKKPKKLILNPFESVLAKVNQ